MTDTFLPTDYLDFSNTLFCNGSINKNNSVCRSIVSRSYYSAFLATREKIDEIQKGFLSHGDFIPGRKRKESHKEIIDAILTVPHPKFNQSDRTVVYQQLITLCKYRVNADYKFINAKHQKEKNFEDRLDPTTSFAAKKAITLANSVISVISAL